MKKSLKVKEKLLSLLLIFIMFINTFPLVAVAETLVESQTVEVVETKESSKTEVLSSDKTTTSSQIKEAESSVLESETPPVASTTAEELIQKPLLVKTTPVNRSDLVKATKVNLMIYANGQWVYVIKDGEIQVGHPTIVKGTRVKFEYFWEITSQNLSQFQPEDYFEMALPTNYFKYANTANYELRDQKKDLIGHFNVTDNKIVATLNETGTTKNEIKNGFFYGIGDTISEGEDIIIETEGLILPPITIGPGVPTPIREIHNYGYLSKSGYKYEERDQINWTIHANYINATNHFNGETVVPLSNVILIDELEEGLIVKENELKIEAPMHVATENGKMSNLAFSWYSMKEQLTLVPYLEGTSEHDFVNAVKNNGPAYGVYAGRKVIINFGNLPGAGFKFPNWAIENNGQHIKNQLTTLINQNRINQAQADMTYDYYRESPEVLGFIITIPTTVVGGSKTYNNKATLTYSDDESISKEAKVEFKELHGGAETNEPGTVIIKKIDDFQQPLVGVSFKLQKFNQDSQVYEDYTPRDNEGQIERTTNEEGIVSYKRLSHGKFRVVETEGLKGYGEPSFSPSDIFEITEQDTEGIEITVINKILRGAVELIKSDETTSEKLGGAVFNLLNSEGTLLSSGHRTDENGWLKINDLLPGDYQLVETAAPLGYELDETPVEFKILLGELGRTVVKKTNKPKTGGLILKKSDAETGELLANAVFELQTQEGLSLSSGHQTDAQGRLTIDGLLPGNYQLIETAAPTGYELDAIPLTFEIVKNQKSSIELTMKNKQMPGAVILKKSDEESGHLLQGAVFELRSASGELLSENHETDENGSLSIAELKPGSYQLIETKAPAGYLLEASPILFDIVKGQTSATMVTKTNEPLVGTVILTKIDEETEVTLAGALFSLLDKDGQLLLENMETDQLGQLVISELKPGTYQLIETKAPIGYLLDEEALSFEIKAEKNTVVSLVKTNRQLASSVILTKLDGKTGKTLAGAIFELQDEKGQVIKSQLTSDNQGRLVVTDLALGRYHLVETQAPKGYILDGAPVSFTLTEQTETLQLTKNNFTKDKPDKPYKPVTKKKITLLPQTSEEAGGNLIGLGLMIMLLASKKIWKRFSN